MNKQEIKDKISEMENELVKLKEELNGQEKPSRRWKPEFHDKYYYIDSTGVVCVAYWEDYEVDKIRYALGNCFKTYKEAVFAMEQLKVIAELKEYADDDKKWNCSNAHWCINYEADNGHIEVGCYHDTIISFNIYFSSPEQTQKAINAIGEERLKKYYFCVEE